MTTQKLAVVSSIMLLLYPINQKLQFHYTLSKVCDEALQHV
jgi:hypothetical protein